MDINEMVGEVRAAVVRPGDTAIISIDRYLSGQQLAELGKHFQRKLPNVGVVVLQKGMSVDLIKATPSGTNGSRTV